MPFWAWNAELDEKELIRQIKIFKSMGFGGFFMHSRVGLKTPYMGEKWFSCIKSCVDTAKELGMYAGLYDEDRWPSGAAGGVVTANDEYKSKWLKCDFAELPLPAEFPVKTLGFFAIEGDREKRFCRKFRKLSENFTAADLERNEFPIRIWYQNEPNSEWFNGQTYLDTMNPEAVDAFIADTHEKYFAETGDKFGKTIPLIFTDEPCYIHFGHMALPWTPALPDEFRKEWKRDLREVLPELFFSLPQEVSLTKWQYYNTITRLFTVNYGGRIGKWCGRHDLKLTGHILGEDSMSSQSVCVGAAMRFYEFMQIPGIDQLTEIWNIFIAVKQCVSAARQFGKPERLSELYGCTGWEFPLSGHLALGDWQYALGINFRVPHLAHYSMGGEAKRDYPASISYQSPYCRCYHRVEEHFARLGAILRGCDEIRELLVVHPIESFWSTMLPFPDLIPEKRPPEDKAFEKLTMELLSQNLDFDYADEEIFSRLGRSGKNSLTVGSGSYKAVLLPEMKTIRSSTLKLLTEFTRNGGVVAYLGKIPEFVDAVYSTEAKSVYNDFFIHVDLETLSSCLSPAARRISISDKNGDEIRPMLSFFGKQKYWHVLFINNFGKEFADEMLAEKRLFERTASFDHAEIKVTLPFCGKVWELFPDSGKIRKKSFRHDGKNYSFYADFAPRESRLFLLGNDVPEKFVSHEEIPQKFTSQLPLSQPAWQYSTDEKNVLVLDHSEIKCDGEMLWENIFVLNADSTLRKKLGGSPRGGAMIQPYLTTPDPQEKSLPLELGFDFETDFIPQELFLAVEEPEKWQIALNGHPVFPEGDRWWIDRTIRQIPLPLTALKTGKNRLTLSGRFTLTCAGLEPVFLLGDFRVKEECLIPPFSTITAGDWCKEGYPYYAGSMTYYRQLPPLPAGKRIFLELPRWEGTAATIQLNDHPEIIILRENELTELTGFIQHGQINTLKITIVGHRRNAMGPFYLPEKWTPWNGSAAFNNCKGNSSRKLVPCGLISNPVIKF